MRNGGKIYSKRVFGDGKVIILTEIWQRVAVGRQGREARPRCFDWWTVSSVVSGRIIQSLIHSFINLNVL